MTTPEPKPIKVIRLGTGGAFIAPVFLAMAWWFLYGAAPLEVPPAATPKLNKARLATGAARSFVDTNPPRVHVNEFDRTCNECHKTFHNPDPRVTKLQQHRHIKLSHAVNNHCYDCHHEKDRNFLTSKDGEKIPFDQVVSLCAQCHQAIYRDWHSGLHGKRLGYWDTTKGAQKPLVCVACHDPHWPSRPAMSGLKPLPGPHTLRMGKPIDPDEHESKDPLLRAGRGPGHSHEGKK